MQFYRTISPNCCLHGGGVRRQGLPNCGKCPVAQALNELDDGNWEAFSIFTSDFGLALVNLAPMADAPVLGLDPGWVRLSLDARAIPREDWPDMIAKFQIIHRCREATRPSR